MLRPTDQEMVVLKKNILLQIPRGGGMLCHPGPHGKHQGRQKAEGEGYMGKRLYYGFHRKEWVRQLEQTQDWPV